MGRRRSPSEELTALWRRQLREGIGRPSDIAAASELRSLIDRLLPTVLLAPSDGALVDIGRLTSLPLLPEPTGGDLIDFRSGTFNGQVVGVQHVSNTYGNPPPGDAQPGPLDWPLAKDVEPRTHGVRPTRRVKGLPALPPYVGRDQDRMANWALEQARSEGGLVIVLGQAYSGKSRTALAAMAQVLPDHRVFAPAQHEDLRKLPAQLKGRTERCVVWLDDLDVHLGSGGLEPRLLGQLTELEAVVLATMREEAYAKYARRTSAQGRLRWAWRSSSNFLAPGDPPNGSVLRRPVIPGSSRPPARAARWESPPTSPSAPASGTTGNSPRTASGTPAPTRWCGRRWIWPGAD